MLCKHKLNLGGGFVNGLFLLGLFVGVIGAFTAFTLREKIKYKNIKTINYKSEKYEQKTFIEIGQEFSQSIDKLKNSLNNYLSFSTAQNASEFAKNVGNILLFVPVVLNHLEKAGINTAEIIRENIE